MLFDDQAIWFFPLIRPIYLDQPARVRGVGGYHLGTRADGELQGLLAGPPVASETRTVVPSVRLATSNASTTPVPTRPKPAASVTSIPSGSLGMPSC